MVNEFKGYSPANLFLPDNCILEKETSTKDEVMDFLAECKPKDLCTVNIYTIRGYITFYPIEKDGVFFWDRFTFEGNTYNVKEFVTQMATKPQQ